MLTKASIPHATRNLRKSGRSPKRSKTEPHILGLHEAVGVEDINASHYDFCSRCGVFQCTQRNHSLCLKYVSFTD